MVLYVDRPVGKSLPCQLALLYLCDMSKLGTIEVFGARATLVNIVHICMLQPLFQFQLAFQTTNYESI